MRRLMLIVCLILKTEEWSGDGHRAIAALASEFLNYNGELFVAQTFGVSKENVGKTMTDVSVVADSIEWSDTLHFAHIPYRQCNSDVTEMQRVWGDVRCIVTAIANYTQRAANLDSTRGDKAEALMFLIHLIADVHNPMHVSFQEDEGGNRIFLNSPPLDEGARDGFVHRQNLHHVWDYELIRRVQSKLGVYTEDSDHDAKPWLLTDMLRAQIPDKSYEEPYMLRMDAENLSTDQGGIEIAARMASQTASQYTCTHAYKNNDHEWIIQDDSLDEEYLSSRADVAIELMKFSAIRLAETLNAVASLYFRRKQKRAEEERAALAPPVVRDRENIFLHLPFDFDPDALMDESNSELHEEEDDWLDGIVAVGMGRTAQESPIPRTGVKKKPKEKPKNGKKPARKIPPVDEPDMCEGVDLNQVILLKVREFWWITGKSRKGKRWVPAPARTFLVRFEGNADPTPIEFNFDIEFFDRMSFTKSLVARIISKLRKVEFALPPGDTNMEEVKIDESYRQRFGSYFVRKPAACPPIARKKSGSLSKLRNQVCGCRIGQIVFFVHVTTLERGDAEIRTTLTHVSAQIAEGVTVNGIWLVDEHIALAAESTTELHNFLSVLTGSKDFIERSTRMNTSKRPGLGAEMNDLNTLFFSPVFRPLEKIRWVSQFPCDLFSDSDHFHWSI